MNAMVYIRGNRVDYDAWRDQYGAAGWGFDDVLPYFMRSEANTRLGAPLHGRSGPLHVEDRCYTHELSHAFVAERGQRRAEAQRRLQRRRAGGRRALPGHLQGRAALVDQRGLPQAGASPRPTSPSRPAPSPSRIEIARRAGDRRDVPAGRRRAHRRRARREVLLCGGAINSPQLLMLSGIGPAGAPGRARHRRQGRARRGRRQPAGPPAGAAALAHPRHRPTSAELNNLRNFARWKVARHAVRSPPTSPRPARSSPAATGCRRPTCRSTWRRPASTTTASTSRPAGCSPRRPAW